MTASTAGRDRRLARFAPEIGYALATSIVVVWPGWRSWSSLQVLLAYPTLLYLCWKTLQIGFRWGLPRHPAATTGAARSTERPSTARDWAKWPVTMSLAGVLAVVLFGLLWPLTIERFDGSGLPVDRIDLPLDALRGAIVLGFLSLAFGPTLERWAVGPRRGERGGQWMLVGTHVAMLGLAVGSAVLAIGDGGLGAGLGRSLPLGALWGWAAAAALAVGLVLWFDGRWLPLYVVDLLMAVSLGGAISSAQRSWPPGVGAAGDLVRVLLDPSAPAVEVALVVMLLVTVAASASTASFTPPPRRRPRTVGR